MLAKYVSGLVVLAAGWAAAEEPPDAAGTRALYYTNRAKSEPLPPIKRRPPAVKQQAAPSPVLPVSSPPSAPHLGLRYNLVLVTSATKSEAVDSDRVFRKGDCLAIDFEANRSGYLYVLARQSSGSWHPMFPSPQMRGESNVIDPGRKVRVPGQYCFEISDPPGVEHLFVILSRDSNDLYKLDESIKNKPDATSPPQSGGQPTLIADARTVNTEVARIADRAGTRDLLIRKISQPADAQEPPHSVYVVNGSEKPSSSIIAEIKIQHR